MAEVENRSTHKVYEKDKLGEVQIADEVVAIIAEIGRASCRERVS